jgi:hypothetical protein
MLNDAPKHPTEETAVTRKEAGIYVDDHHIKRTFCDSL